MTVYRIFIYAFIYLVIYLYLCMIWHDVVWYYVVWFGFMDFIWLVWIDINSIYWGLIQVHMIAVIAAKDPDDWQLPIQSLAMLVISLLCLYIYMHVYTIYNLRDSWLWVQVGTSKGIDLRIEHTCGWAARTNGVVQQWITHWVLGTIFGTNPVRESPAHGWPNQPPTWIYQPKMKLSLVVP